MITLSKYLSSPPRRMDNESRDHQDDAPSNQDASRPRIVGSDELLQGARELWIEHGDEMYRLRLTRSGKLYLTK